MSTEETASPDDANTNQTSNGEQSSSPQPTETISAAPAGAPPANDPKNGTATATAPAEDHADNDDEHSRAPGDVDFGQLLDQFEQEQAAFQEGEVVRGTVVGITERGVVIDFGYKSEGIVNPAEFTENGELMVKRGDEVDVLVKSMETHEGFPVLSRADAVRMRAWDDLEKAFNEGTSIKGRIIERIKGGLRVDVDGIAAFLPGSQVDTRPVRNLDSLRNQEIEAKVIKLNRKRSNVVLSRKAVLEDQNADRKGATLGQIEEDIIVEGQIKNLTDYGAFVDLGGIDGLLHVTDMSWGRLQSPADIFRVGDTVQVKVLKFDRERERVSLGYKQLLPDPWGSIEERFPISKQLNGKVASVTDYGAFIELEPGVEGLVHVSEMSWSKRVKHPSKLVNPGDEVIVEVLSIDPKARRISLGMKQVQDNPWQTLNERYQVGSRIQGRVRNLTDFGAFIEVEDGVDGLVHVSDISRSRRIKHPGEVLKKGQEIEAIVTSIDAENRRLSLSLKDLQPNAWDRFVETHNPGDVVKGKIARFANFGAFVELDENLEGLCHISELSEERVAKPSDVVELGQEMEFKVLRIDPENRRIGLSARAVGKEDEPVVNTKTYSSEVGSGMASLGELADFGSNRNAPAETSEPSGKEDDKATSSPASESDSSEESKSEAIATAEPEASASSESEPGAEAETEPEAEASAVAEPEASASAEPEAEAGASAEPESDEESKSDSSEGSKS